mgnify:CR=1 FL=1
MRRGVRPRVSLQVFALTEIVELGLLWRSGATADTLVGGLVVRPLLLLQCCLFLDEPFEAVQANQVERAGGDRRVE